MLMSYFLYRVSSNQPEAQRIYELLIPATEFGEFEFSRTFSLLILLVRKIGEMLF